MSVPETPLANLQREWKELFPVPLPVDPDPIICLERTTFYVGGKFYRLTEVPDPTKPPAAEPPPA